MYSRSWLYSFHIYWAYNEAQSMIDSLSAGDNQPLTAGKPEAAVPALRIALKKERMTERLLATLDALERSNSTRQPPHQHHPSEGLGCLVSAFPVVSAENTAPAKPVLEMEWGDLEDPGASGGVGMRVTLLADGQLSCQYAFLEAYMGFSGSTSSVGKVAPRRMQMLEHVFTDAQYLALPPTTKGRLGAVACRFRRSVGCKGDSIQMAVLSHSERCRGA